MRRLIRKMIPLTFITLVAGCIVYFRSEGFAQSWRDYIVHQLEERGLFLNLRSLRLDPFDGGLVAGGIEIYQQANRKTLLARVDRLNVDLDLSKLVHREVQVQGVDLRDANLAFPLDPDDPKSELLELGNLNALIMFDGDHIEVRRAEGDLFGLHLSVTGSLLKPPPSTEEEEEKSRQRARERLAAIRARRDLILETAKMLKHFKTAHAPRLEIEVNGDLGKPEELNAALHLTADGLRHGDYVCEQLFAEATYAGRLVDLQRLHVKDHLGELEASATYEIEGSSVDFHLRSRVNLSKLAAAVFEKEELHEVVFYEPPEIEADGRVLLGSSVPKDAFVPVECSGSVHAGRFASRGEVLDGLSLNFGLAPRGCSFRDVLLRHKSGTLNLQAMWQKPESFRYRALLRMDPHVFLPFFKLPQTQEFIQRFGFRDESGIYAEVEGEGKSPDVGNDCHNIGRAELHHFKYNGVEFARMESDIEFEGPQHFFRNMLAERAEGAAGAKQIDWDDDAHTVRFEKLVSDVDPVAVVGCFAPDTAAVIARYRFDKHPHAEVDGLLALHGGGTDMRVKFRSDGVGHYVLWGDDYTVSKPVGDLGFKGPKLAYDVSGSVFGKEMRCKGDVDLSDGANDYTVDFRAGLFPYPVFTKPLPFEKVRAMVTCRKGIADYDLKATLLDGDFSMRGKVDDRKSPQDYTADLRVNAVNFKKFGRVYTPDYDTEGDLSSHAEVAGKLGDWKSLKGRGAVVILNSNLYAVPILGPLTPLLGALLPKPIKGYNVAKDVDATFTLADGFATTNDVVASTKVFEIVAKGKVDYLEDRIQFHAQVKFGKLLGLVLFPVSKILEYTGEGTVEEPLWRPRFFSVSSEKTPFRKSDDPVPPPAKPEPQPKSAPSFTPLRPSVPPKSKGVTTDKDKPKDDQNTAQPSRVPRTGTK